MQDELKKIRQAVMAISNPYAGPVLHKEEALTLIDQLIAESGRRIRTAALKPSDINATENGESIGYEDGGRVAVRESGSQALINEFKAYWDKRVRSGKNSSFSGLEMMAIEIFLGWLKKRRKVKQ